MHASCACGAMRALRRPLASSSVSLPSSSDGVTTRPLSAQTL